jgi:hypothetical protein
MYSVVVRYRNGRMTPMRQRIAELGEAASLALGLADELGLDLDAAETCPPAAVEIRDAARLMLSIVVLPGGLISDYSELTGQRAQPRSAMIHQ